MSSNRGEPRSDRRSEAREQALGLLYEASTKGVAASEVLEARIVPVESAVDQLVRGVADRTTVIDELISSHSRDWSIERMPTLDVIVLRIGIYELLDRPDVPVAVVIDEAVELAKTFSTDDSGRFANGVLAAVAKKVRDNDQ